MTADRRRLIVTDLCEHFSVSQRRASRALDLPRSSLRYAPVARDERAALARRIEELAGTHPRFGYRRIWALCDREGWSVNLKAVRRIWRLSGLKLARPRATPKPAGRTGRTRTRATSGRRAGKTMYGHGTLSSTVPATAGASSG
jgi:putative transposase